MTISEKLLEDEIKNEQFLESYKGSVLKSFFAKQKVMRLQFYNIFNQYFGKRIGVRTRRDLNHDSRIYLDEMQNNMSSIISERGEDLLYTLKELEADRIEEATGKKPNIPEDDLSSVLAVPVIINSKKAITIDSSLEQWRENYDRDILSFTLRMNSAEDSTENTRNAYLQVVKINREYSMAIISTALALIASRIKFLFAKQNRDLFKGYSWVSVLDGKTSDICLVRNGKFWLFGDSKNSTLGGEFYPPAHYRCRSGISYISVEDNPPDIPSYEEWFERQSDKVKEDILGPSRYAMYSRGSISVRSFFDVDASRRLTIDELRKLSIN